MTHTDDPPLVGIDLGTTNSLVAVFAEGRPQLIPNAYGRVLTPSVVAVLENGQVVVGEPAKEYRVTRPASCCWAFKRWMGTNRSVQLGNKKLTAPELSSLVLRSLKDDVENHLGQAVTEAVITVPAYFNDHQRKATRLAGEMAGLKVRRMINEPTAAALTYGFHERQSDKKLIVVDLGGGTFDVTLMEVFEGTLEIIATAGESFLGGEDFTDRLAAAILASQNLSFEAMEHRCPLLVARLREECEAAKRLLAQQDTAAVRLPNEQGEFARDVAAVPVTRESFAADVAPLLERLRGPIAKALGDGRTSPEQVHEVILVGGATRMPALVGMIGRYFGKEPRCTCNPDEVVALGAAVQAALIIDDEAVNDMVMTDVCPHTLGVEVVKQFGEHHEQGYFSPIIHRNTTIPVSREEWYFTIDDNQAEILLKVFQGEARRVKDNLYLGELTVSGIPRGSSGQRIIVRFTYDLNGILEVEAFVPGASRKFQTVLTNQNTGMSHGEIQEAVRRMQAIKFYPRDDLVNQRLVRFCERMVGEVAIDQRAGLEAAIDQFEQAMSSGRRERFEDARETLLLVLSQLGIDYSESDGAQE